MKVKSESEVAELCSSRPHGLQHTRLLRSWDFPGERAGVGCHCLLLLANIRGILKTGENKSQDDNLRFYMEILIVKEWYLKCQIFSGLVIFHLFIYSFIVIQLIYHVVLVLGL